MEKRKIIFGILIVIFIIIIVVIVKKSKNKDETTIDYPVDETIRLTEEKRGKVRELDNISEYFTIDKCVNKFYNDYMTIFDEDIEDSQMARDSIYNYLASDYIESREITKDNILEKIPVISKSNILINNIFKYNENDNIDYYFINGKLITNDSLELIDFNIELISDKINETFCIYLDDYLRENNLLDLKKDSNIEINKVDSIEKKDNNNFSNSSATLQMYANKLFDNIRMMLLFDKESAYNLLTDQAKKDFGSAENFNNFINDNRLDIFLMSYGNYEVNNNDDNLVYICYDNRDIFYLSVEVESITEYKYSISKY